MNIHTAHHNKNVDTGRSPDIESYIDQSVAWLLKHAAFESAPLTIHDWGCDNGYFLRALCDAGVSSTQCVGIDSYENSNPFALDIRKLDMAGDLPFEDMSVDLLILNHSLEHVENPHAVLRNAKRLLRSTGHLFLGLPHAAFPWSVWDGHVSLWTPEFVKHVLSTHGFRCISQELRCFRDDNVEILTLLRHA